MDFLSPRMSLEKRRALEFDEDAFWSTLDMSPTFRSKRSTKLAFQDDGENMGPGRSKFASALATLSPRLSQRFSPRSVRKKGKPERGSPRRALSLNSLSPRMNIRGLRRLKASRVQPEPPGGYSSEGSQRPGGQLRRSSSEIQKYRGGYASEGSRTTSSLPRRYQRAATMRSNRRNATDLRRESSSSEEPSMRVESLRVLSAALESPPEAQLVSEGLRLPIPRRHSA